MKKILLSVVALVAAMSVNAQESAPFTNADADRVGLGDDKVEVAGGTVLLETANVTCTLAYDQSECGRTGLSKNNVKINGADFGSETGIQGSTNGPGAAASEGTYPENACMYHFTVKKDGYLYVFHKASANKNYVVFENKLRVPYSYSAVDGGAYDLNTIEGAIDEATYGYPVIAADYAIGQAQVIIGTDGLGAGTCVIKFPVYAGAEYDALATGSKMTFAGFYFDETGDATITAGEDEAGNEIVLLNAGQIPSADPAGIQKVQTAAQNGAIYNVAGQKVDENYKGLVIKNGKKVVQ